MNGLIEPNLHPLIVHFVIAFLITGPILLLLARVGPERWRERALTVGDGLLAFGIGAALVAIAAGLQAYYSVAHDSPSHAAMTDHRNWAFVTTGIFLAVGFGRFRTRKQAPSIVLILALLVPTALLGITGWKGGHLVYHYGLGVESLPAVTGEGHDHEHTPGEGHGSDDDSGHEAHVEPDAAIHNSDVLPEVSQKSEAHEHPEEDTDHHDGPLPEVEKETEHDHSTHDH